MIISIKDSLKLSDGNEYVVVSKTYYNNKNYYYLIDINNKSNIKFCYENNEELIELDSKELSRDLMLSLIKTAYSEINK